jgi:hypothetical protein
MFKRLAFAVFLLVTAFEPAISRSTECPTFDGEEIRQLLVRSTTCEGSLALFKACSFGAGGDIELSQVVVKKCEGDFLTKLSTSQRRKYDREQKRCVSKYQSHSGTMYRSFEAFCSANLAQTYSQRFTKDMKQRGK